MALEKLQLAGPAAALVASLLVLASPYHAAAAEDESIRPFKVQVPQAALDDLRRRIRSTRWPDKETVADRSHLHVIVDDLPWWWADPSNTNTIDIAGLPPGQHKVKIALVDANHNVFPGQVVTLTFTVPDYDRAKVYGHGH